MRLHNRGPTTKGKVREDPEIRELMQAKKRAPPTPTPPNGSRKASSPDFVLFPSEPPPLSEFCGAASKTTKTRRPSSGLWTSEDARPLCIYSRRLPSTRGPPLSPEQHSRFYTHPFQGNRQDRLRKFSASFYLLFRTILQYDSLLVWEGAKKQKQGEKQ